MCDYPDFYSHETRKAKKQHSCCECDGIIEIGEKYNYYYLIFDRQPYSFKVCLDCDNLRNKIDEGFSYEDHCPFGEIGYFVSESNERVFALDFLNIIKKRNSKTKTDYLERIINNSED